MPCRKDSGAVLADPWEETKIIKKPKQPRKATEDRKKARYNQGEKIDIKKVQCHNCGIFGYFKFDCRKPVQEKALHKGVMIQLI